VTAEELAACTGATVPLAVRWLPDLLAGMAHYSIDTPLRRAHFLPNVGHESGGLRYTSELWGPTPAQRGYEGRKDLGNIHTGDGSLFRGHGLIQTTGRYNHARVRDLLRRDFPGQLVPDFEALPALLAQPPWAALSACAFWNDNGINAFADADDFDGSCDKVNRGRKTSRVGDSNGWEDRLRLHVAARRVLGLA